MSENHHDDDTTRTHVVLSKGTMVGHYRIVERIGAGGMGDVYLADDSELDRKAALKFLPHTLCQDERCRARFKREAQAVAKLDHQNIITIFDVGEFTGRPYFAMQYIRGKTLREMTTSGRPSVNQILDMAIQIIQGLQAAHDAGVIHRDIKPSNILVDSQGKVKLLDFGLAYIAGAEELTRTGSTLGTLAYMSPEQVKAEGIDHRSDIFSFGIVFYEMLTGHSPFRKETEAATLKSILDHKPAPLDSYRDDLPDRLQSILDLCLEKNPDRRYQTVADILENLRYEYDQSAPLSQRSAPVRPRRFARRLVWSIAGMVAVILCLVLVYIMITPTEPDFSVPIQKQITFYGDTGVPLISPDGQYLAYLRGNMEINTPARLYVQELSGGQPIEIFEGQYIPNMRWSPDGRHLLVAATIDSLVNGVFLIPRFGGDPRRFELYGYSLSWSPDGSRFVQYDNPGRHLVFVEVESGNTAMIKPAKPVGVRDLDWSPDGERLLLLCAGRGNRTLLCTVSTHGDKLNVVLDSTVLSPRWSPRGDAIYCIIQSADPGREAATLAKIEIDPSSGKAVGRPRTLMSRLPGSDQISISADGKRLVYASDASFSNVWYVRLPDSPLEADAQIKQLTSGTVMLSTVCISPDGGLAAFAGQTGDKWHIYSIPTDGGRATQVTYTGSINFAPSWSPDGNRLAYLSQNGEHTLLAVMDINRGVPVKFDRDHYCSPLMGQTAWYPGEKILFRPIGHQNFFLFDPQTEDNEPLVPDTNGFMHFPCYSPDGKRVAFFWQGSVAGEGGDPGLGTGTWIASVEDHTASLLSSSGFYPLVWSSDGKWIYFRADSDTMTICRMPVDGGIADTIFSLPFESISWDALHPGGKDYVCIVNEFQSDVWLVENFDPYVK